MSGSTNPARDRSGGGAFQPPRRGGGFMGGGGPMHGLLMPAAKAKNFRGSLGRLAERLRPESFGISVVVALAIVGVVLNVVAPKVLANATNLLFEGVIGKGLGKEFPGISLQQIIEGMRARGLNDQANMISGMHVVPGVGVDFGAIATVLLAVLVIYVFASIFTWISSYVMAGVSQRTVYRMRRDVDLKLARLPLKYFDSHPRGDILSRVTNDIDNIANTLQQSLTQIITSLFTVVGVLVMMLWISPILALLSVLVIPVTIVLTIFIAKRSQKEFAAQWERTGTLNGHVEETHTGHSVVKVFGHQQDAIRRFDDQNEQLFQASFRAQFISGIIQPVMMFVGNLNYVAICVVGGLQVATGAMSLGDVLAFVQYSRQFTMPITQVASIMNVLQSTVASAERVFELLDEPEEIPDTETPQVLAHPQGRIAFEDVSFRYEPDAPLIEDLDLDVAPGATVAIVGPTGAGKTTLVNLLMRFYEIDRGRIEVDGIDTRDLTRANLRSTFGMVLQDAWLFGGTIRENIAYGCEGATEEQILAAARDAHVDHFVRTLPHGYDTVIDDDASNLSQGEKQLLTIARAFLADPQILILDEATSSVDTRTEVLIQRAMARLMKGRTSFVIAHRLSTIRDADTILVMNRGRIIEQGSHEELLARHGFYYDLYNSQFVEALEEAV